MSVTIKMFIPITGITFFIKEIFISITAYVCHNKRCLCPLQVRLDIISKKVPYITSTGKLCHYYGNVYQNYR